MLLAEAQHQRVHGAPGLSGHREKQKQKTGAADHLQHNNLQALFW